MSTARASQNRSAGISYQALIARDEVPPPQALTLESQPDIPLVSVPVSRYTTQAFHELEMQRLWPKVWQMACREEEIPGVGDYMIYEIGRHSIIVVRTQDGIQAHHNVCRHRGRQVVDHDGHVANFICPFHGFAYNLDGSLREVPSEWDFPHVDAKQYGLTPVKVGTWGGWVFVNMDLDAEPLASFLEELPGHFAVWEPENRYIEAHVGKVINCNWKVAQEAFMEAFHVITTHPQILPSTGDENSQYDAWGNFSRAITPNGTPSPHLRWDPKEQDIYDALTGRQLGDPPAAELGEAERARARLAAAARETLRENVPEHQPITDADAMDSVYYTLFPNFHPWGGFNRIVYRFRPWQGRHDKSLMECYFLSPFKGERPEPAPLHFLSEDDDWTEAPELGLLAKVFQQDSFNLPQVQKGLEAAEFDEVVLAKYQETKIRHFENLLSKWVGQ